MTGLQLITINVGKPKSNEEIKAKREELKRKSKKYEDERRKIVVEKIREIQPDIVFLQEQIKKDVSEIDDALIPDVGKDLEESHYFVQQKDKQAAVLLKKAEFDEPSDIITDNDTKDVSEIRARLVLLKTRAINHNQDLVVGSWHGPHKIKIDKKEEVAKNLLKVLKGKGKPFVVGGDFNLEAESFPEQEAVEYASKDDIDYFIQEGRGIELAGVSKSRYADREAHLFLDHTPRVAKLEI